MSGWKSRTSFVQVGRKLRIGSAAQRQAAPGLGGYVGWIVLGAYCVFLVYQALRRAESGDAENVPLWQLQDSVQFLVWIGGLVAGGLARFACFVPLGFVAVVVVPRGVGRFGRLVGSLAALAASAAFAALVRSIEIGWSWHLAALVGLALPLSGCLFGVWVGTTWLRGRRARLWLLPKIAGLILLVAIFAGIVVSASVEQRSLSFEPARVTSAEKRRLVRLIRSKSPRSLIQDQTHTLRLTEHDINVLLAWGLSLGSPERKAKISLAPDMFSLAASVDVRFDGGKTRYLNLAAAGIPKIQEGTLSLHVKHMRLGAVEMPRWFCRLLSPVVTSQLCRDRRFKPFLDATRALAIEHDALEVTYGPLQLPSGFREDFFGPAGAGNAVLASTRAQVEHLLAAVSQSPDTQSSFGECFELAFGLARERSVESEPATENRAAIFALGILLGHPRIEEFLGSVFVGSENGAARRALRRVPLHGRFDWTKHFCVSAAIALLSDEAVSDAAGLLKEELDADSGGSGFSFSDLLADRAGTTFAVRATQDEASARAMQERIVGGFEVEDFFPPAADLPEGIADSELQSYYGGVGGQEYNRLVDEIERRVAACAAYR